MKLATDRFSKFYGLQIMIVVEEGDWFVGEIKGITEEGTRLHLDFAWCAIQGDPEKFVYSDRKHHTVDLSHFEHIDLDTELRLYSESTGERFMLCPRGHELIDRADIEKFEDDHVLTVQDRQDLETLRGKMAHYTRNEYITMRDRTLLRLQTEIERFLGTIPDPVKRSLVQEALQHEYDRIAQIFSDAEEALGEEP